MSSYILAINCGSSSIKSKLFLVPDNKDDALKAVADVTVKNIGSKGDKVKFKISWEDAEGTGKLGKDLEEDGEAGDAVEYKKLPPQLLERLIKSSEKLEKSQIKAIGHRVVHGGPTEKPITVTKEHEEGLERMDKLSEFAPLHNHSAVLAIRACLSALPDHTSVLLFDTLFHQTLPKEVYTYAIPPQESGALDRSIPLRKYGFHGLSYMSILGAMAKKLNKKEEDVSIVVAHLGSGGSSCCIRKGKSIDTSMGLTPLEGLVGGTRSGSIDPTLIFHLVPGAAEDAGLEGIKVSRAEATLNKKSGLQAVAGTANFGTITTRMTDKSSCSEEEHSASTLAYDLYVDRLMFYLTGYLSKLLGSLDGSEVDGIVFSGGIGEKSDYLRADVARRLGWMGISVDKARNEQASKGEEVVSVIHAEGSKVGLYVVQTDEEEVCARMTREELGL